MMLIETLSIALEPSRQKYPSHSWRSYPCNAPGRGRQIARATVPGTRCKASTRCYCEEPELIAPFRYISSSPLWPNFALWQSICGRCQILWGFRPLERDALVFESRLRKYPWRRTGQDVRHQKSTVRHYLKYVLDTSLMRFSSPAQTRRKVREWIRMTGITQLCPSKASYSFSRVTLCPQPRLHVGHAFSRRWLALIFATLGICHNHCVIMYVYIGDQHDHGGGGTLTFYIPARMP